MAQPVYGMPIPNTRGEFERNIYLLVEETGQKLNSGNESLRRNAMWASFPGVSKLRKLPNGRLNLITVDERTRLQSNMLNWTDL